jgi:cyclase
LKLNAVDWARHVEKLGAGEIILNSIERDGTMSGYDLDLIKKVASAVDIPVVASGGAGCYADLFDAFSHGAHAVAAGAMWVFSDATPAEAAEYLHGRGLNVRRH